jgi:hypothetical protein
MSKRLQVLLDEAELSEIQRAARSQKMTVAEWVRRTLRTARDCESAGDAKKKLEVVRAASRHSYPTADIDQMIADIESGYGSGEGV